MEPSSKNTNTKGRFAQVRALFNKQVSRLRSRKAVPFIVFVVGFALVGSYLLFFSNAATNTTTFTGKLTKRAVTKSHSFTAAAGQLDTTLSFSGTNSMVITITSSSGSIIGSRSGPSPLALSVPVTGGTYTFSLGTNDPISSKGAPYTLNVNVMPTPPCSNSGTASGSDAVITNCTASFGLQQMLIGPMASRGSVTVTHYWEEFTSPGRHWLYFRDSVTGAFTHLEISDGTNGGWGHSKIAWTDNNQIWLEGGNGPVVVRGYQVNGIGTLPSSLTSIDKKTFGDTDSRTGNLLALKSGAVVAQWHQSGQTGPQGHWLAYRTAAGVWNTPQSLQFMPTFATITTMAQHPADNSIWLFNDPDAFGAIGAAHLTEVSGTLKIDWTDANFIAHEGPYNETLGTYDYGPDPENPDIVAVPNIAKGTISLAYESSYRTTITGIEGSPYASYPVIADIKADKTKTFIQLPIYVERISKLSLAVSNGSYWLAYHPVDGFPDGPHSFKRLQISKYSSGAWSSPVDLGDIYTKDPSFPGRFEFQTSAISRPEFLIRKSDNKLHFFTLP